MMAAIFSGLASMPRSETIKPSSIPLGTPKTHFLGFEFDAVCVEFRKGLFEVGDNVVGPFGFNHDVVDIGLNGPPDEVPKAVEHTALVSRPSIL